MRRNTVIAGVAVICGVIGGVAAGRISAIPSPPSCTIKSCIPTELQAANLKYQGRVLSDEVAQTQVDYNALLSLALKTEQENGWAATTQFDPRTLTFKPAPVPTVVKSQPSNKK